MRPNDFRTLLIAASFEATRFAQRFVFDVLPFTFRYVAYLNESCDSSAGPEFVLYAQDDGKVVTLDSEVAVIDLLLRDGRCPQWIDVAVIAVAPHFTLLRLRCCGRFTDDRSKLYYDERGFGPFGIKSPDFPPNWKEGSRFKLKSAE
jgi:hypothetical protein